MIFYIFALIVFISEIVLAVAILSFLLKLDKFAVLYNDFLNEAKPKIKDLLKILNKISEQMVELAPIVVDKVKSYFFGIVISQFKNMVGCLVFFSVKKEVEKRLQ